MSKKHFRFALTDTTAEFRRQGHASTDIRDVTTQIDDVSVFVSLSSRMRNLSIHQGTCYPSTRVVIRQATRVVLCHLHVIHRAKKMLSVKQQIVIQQAIHYPSIYT